MTTKRKKSTSDGAGTRTGSASGLEAAAFGTTAGAILLGIAQADAAQRDEALAAMPAASPRSDREATETTEADSGSTQDSSVSSGDRPSQGRAVTDDGRTTPVADHQAAANGAPTLSEPAAVDTADPAAGVSDQAAKREDIAGKPATPQQTTPPVANASSVSSSAPPTGQDSLPANGLASDAATASMIPTVSLSDRIAGEITDAIGRISDGLADGESTEALGREIGGRISEAATAIAGEIETAIATTQSATADLRESLGAAIEADVADALGPVLTVPEEIADLPAPGDLATSITEAVETGLSNSGLASLDDISGQVLTKIPSTLLGAESENDLPGGLLSELFYSDGDASTSDDEISGPASVVETASQSIPALASNDKPSPVESISALDQGDILSDAATMLSEGGNLKTVDFAGISYADAPDLPYGGMHSAVNALGLL